VPVTKSNPRKVSSNIGLLGVTHLAGRGVGFLLTVTLARYLGEQGFGQFMYALSWVMIGNMVADFGINNLVIREVAKDRDRAAEYLTGSLIIRGGIAILATVGLIGLSAGLGVRGTLLRIIALLLLLVPIQIVISSCGAIFQAFERMGICGSVDCLRSTLTAVGVLAMIPWGLSVWNAALSYLGAGAAVAVVSFAIARCLIDKPLDHWRVGALLRLVYEALPFLAVGLIFIIQDRSSIFILGLLHGDGPVARYAAAYELIDGLHLSVVVVSMATFPVFSRTSTADPKALDTLSRASMKYLVLLGVGMAVGLFVLASDVIHWVYGNAYAEAATALRILALGIPVFFQRTLLGTILTAADRLRSLFLVYLIGFVLNVLAGWLIISYFADGGAAAVTVLASLCVMLGCGIIAPKEVRRSCFAWYPRALLVGIVMAILVASLDQLNLFLRILTGMVVYGAGLFAFGCISYEDLRRLASVAPSGEKLDPASRPQNIGI